MVGLAATVPAKAYVESKGLYRLIYGSSMIAAVLIVTDGLDRTFSLDLPLLPLPEVGTVGADAASIFVALGILALALAAFRPEQRLRLFTAAGALLTAPALAGQRAAILGLAVSLLVLLIGLVATTRRLRATPTEFALLFVMGLGLATLPPAAALALGSPDAQLLFSGSVEETFSSTAKQQSEDSRINQWRKAGDHVDEQRPLTGWGLGKTYTHYDPGHRGVLHHQLHPQHHRRPAVADRRDRRGAVPDRDPARESRRVARLAPSDGRSRGGPGARRPGYHCRSARPGHGRIAVRESSGWQLCSASPSGSSEASRSNPCGPAHANVDGSHNNRSKRWSSRDLVRTLKRFRLLAAGVFAGVMLLGLAAAFLPADKYRASSTLLVEPSGDDVDFSDVEAVRFLLPALAERVDTSAFHAHVEQAVPAEYRDEGRDARGIDRAGHRPRPPDPPRASTRVASRSGRIPPLGR